MAALCALCALAVPAADARGLHRDDAPWYAPDLADTTVALAFAVTYVPSPRAATLFHAVLSGWRRGPLRLATSWSFVSVRGADGQSFGFGDPKLFARLRLAGRDSTVARIYVEGGARVPTAEAKLFPYASGGQELDLWGTCTVGRFHPWLVTAAGYSWTEPSRGLVESDVPHSLRAFVQLGGRRDGWAAAVRGDFWWMEGGLERNALEARLTRLEAAGMRITAAGGLEIGPRTERAVESFVHLRFAIPLR